ncbi:MAG: NAD(P)/FAD-dependent oxidoreductase [Candidatus Heimdallarchaeota archaeon]
MSTKYNIIVIGAGFGGPVAAKICSDAGLKTLMLERSENVGEKVISGLTIPFYGFLFGPDFIRDGNPPFERPADGIVNYIIKDIDKNDIDIDDSLKVPKPFSPIIAFGYHTYCKPFCEWLSRKAGVELRTSTTITDVIKEDGVIKGVITDKGEEIRSKIVIDAEGSQGLIAIKAGVREKYPPETISLADTYDYEMPKRMIDQVFGYSVKMCWGWDEQKIAPPLGFGNGLMVWPYRNSLHFMQDQCLKIEERVPNLRKLFDLYHKNITSKLPWWREQVAPFIKLRARMWEGFEIYVGLDKKLRNMPNHTSGMILIGDAAGLESTELCDGVPAAWFSAEIAAKIAIQAIKANDTSVSFLKRYDNQIKSHPIIQWSISARNRYNLRVAQKEHNEKKLKKYIHNGWGLGSLTQFTTPFLKILIDYVRKDPQILSKWIKMYFRYYQNWLHENYDYSEKKFSNKEGVKRPKFKQNIFLFSLISLNSIVKLLYKFKRLYKWFLFPFTQAANTFMKNMLKIIEPLYLLLIKLIEPWANIISNKLIKFVDRADPAIFSEQITIKGELK